MLLISFIFIMLRGGAEVARQAHNLKAVGSIPAPATSNLQPVSGLAFFIFTYPVVAKTFANFIIRRRHPGKLYSLPFFNVLRLRISVSNGLDR